MSTITILHEGEWKSARIVGYGANGALQGAMLNEPCVTMQVTGTSFAPKVELAVGSTATVYWMDMATGRQLATGLNPTITWQTAATRTVGLRVDDGPTPKFQDVRVLNFGFNAAEDSGAYNIGTGYNYASQPITSIANLQFLPNLRYFLAAGTPLTGHVDFTGLSQLEHIECFNARVQSLDLTGCTSLIRLCMEANSLSNLDLNPVRSNLRDLRAAVQNTPSLTFATLSGAMTQLYHYCIRDQIVHNIIPHAQLPVIEEHWAWNTGQTTSDAPTSPLLRSYASHGNAYDQASVDLILTTLASLITNGGWRSVDISGGAIPSATGLTAATTLRNNGWAVLIAEPATRLLPVPIAAYGFNENVGTIAYDSSGNGRDVSLPTGSTWAAGHNGSGFNPSTISTYGGRTQIAMGSLSAFTLMAWVYVTNDDSGGVVFNFASAESYDSDTTVGVNIEMWGAWLAIWSNPGGPSWSERYADPVLTVDAWHHLAVSSDGDTLTIFLGGNAISTSSWTLPSASYSLNIGNDFIHQVFPNAIDDVRVFDTALTAAEVATYMEQPIDGTISLFDTPTFTVQVAQEPEAYTLGTEFNVASDCELVAIRWWQGTGTPDLSTRTANVWKLVDGWNWVAQLAEPVEIPGSAATDTWLRGDLDAPITLTPGVYRVGVFHPHGHFSATGGYFAGNTLVTRGPLTLPYQDIATNNQQGNYSAEATIHAPDQPPYQSRNYWADVVVRPL